MNLFIQQVPNIPLQTITITTTPTLEERNIGGDIDMTSAGNSPIPAPIIGSVHVFKGFWAATFVSLVSQPGDPC